MPIDINKIDLVLQYALLVAGEEDEFFDRQLGPIHLIKYAYLADLAFASRNEGKTYTGVDWQFYKFGPWTQAVNERVDIALSAISADKKSFPSDYGDKGDWFRWSIRDERLLREKEQRLPPTITMHLRQEIHKFGKDTPSLLDYVYQTRPMLSAAPNEFLDLTLAIRDKIAHKTDNASLRMDMLSNKKAKKFKEHISDIQEKHKTRKYKERRLINPVTSPRYDEIYNEGIRWLDDLAGQELPAGEKKAEFSDEVWKSLTRKGNDVS